jgi:tetratricopeptide (TPR) repeat protein
MFIRRLIPSQGLLSKATSSFFQSRNYKTGDDLKKYRAFWATLTPRQQMFIAINQRKPACGEVLISKGDFYRNENCFELAIECYNQAFALNKDCETLAKAKIAQINNLKKTDLVDENNSDYRTLAFK